MKQKLEVNTVKPEVSFSHLDMTYRVIDFVDEIKLDGSIDTITNYMSTTNGFGKTEEQKDLDYAYAQSIWKTFQTDLREIKLNFYLDRAQYNLLTDILLKKLEYDVNTVFIAIELTDLLGGMNGTKFTDEMEIKPFKANATEITYMYHLIQNFKVKGLTKEAYTFSKILRRIGDISKIISYYDANAKNLTDEISKWALSLDAIDNPSISELPKIENTEEV
jgi:hypothetical protein